MDQKQKNEKAKERMRRYRAKKTKEATDEDRAKTRIRNAKSYAEKTEEEKANLLKKRRQNYARKVAERKEEEKREKKRNSYIYNEELHNRERMRKSGKKGKQRRLNLIVWSSLLGGGKKGRRGMKRKS